jgi:hypothetical protein
VTAATIAATDQAMSSSTTPIPPTRSSTPRSDRPIRTNTAASSRKIIPCQNERARMRTLAVRTTCWYQPQTRPAVTVAMTPDTCSISPAR